MQCLQILEFYYICIRYTNEWKNKKTKCVNRLYLLRNFLESIETKNSKENNCFRIETLHLEFNYGIFDSAARRWCITEYKLFPKNCWSYNFHVLLFPVTSEIGIQCQRHQPPNIILVFSLSFFWCGIMFEIVKIRHWNLFDVFKVKWEI